MAKCVDSSHDGNGKPGAGIVFQATEKLLSAVSVLMDVCDDTGANRRGALALVTRRENQLIRASAKCDAKVADLRRQLAQRDARIAELEAKLAADRKPTANDRAVERIKKYADDGVCADDWDEACVDCCRHILHIIREEAAHD